MVSMSSPNLGGRRAEAARNDQGVLDAARDVFIESGPAASMADIAARARVGIGTLYRRYPRKVDLMCVVCTEAMRRSLHEARAALDEEPDGWSALHRFVLRSAQLGTGALNGLAGYFKVTDDMLELSRRQRSVIDRIVERAHREGTLRHDLTAPDIMTLIPLVSARASGVGAPERSCRYAQLMVDGMRAADRPALPGEPPTWRAFEHAWQQGAENGVKTAGSPTAGGPGVPVDDS